MIGIPRDRYRGILEQIIKQAANEPGNPEAQAAKREVQEALDELNYLEVTEW